MTKTLITIGITCFNAADTIEGAVESALTQIYQNKEILIVDDCSTDGSVEILEKLCQKYSAVKHVRHKQNSGYPSALNTIIEHAGGEYIAFFDDDDDSRKDRLEKQLNKIETYKNTHDHPIVLCYSNRDVYQINSSTPLYSFRAIGRTPIEPSGSAVADYLMWDTGAPGMTWGMFGSCTLMMSRDELKKIGGFDPNFRRCAEWDMAVRAAQMGAHFIAVDEPLIKQYKTPTSDKSGSKPLTYSLMLREKHRDYLDKKGLYLTARLMAHSRFYGGKGKKYKSLAYLFLSCLSAPKMLLAARIIPKALIRFSGKT